MLVKDKREIEPTAVHIFFVYAQITGRQLGKTDSCL